MGERQAGSESFHADADQVAEIERYAARYSAELVWLPPELSVSGGLPIEQRPSLRTAIEGVERGEYSAVVVANLKRLTRSRSGLQIWDRVEAAGGHVHCAAEGIDTSTPNGRFVRDIHLAEAVREREEHVERFETRRRLATEAGVWQRRQTPRGYSRDPDTRRLVPDDRADDVRQAARDFLAGATTVSLSERLGMTPNGVRQMLRNRVYLGELRVGRHVNPAAHEPILDPETFEAVQAKLSSRVRPHRRSDGPALLAGLVRCVSCGHLMTRGRSGPERAYHCPKRHSGTWCPAPASIACSRLDPHVEQIALAELRRLRVTATQGDRAGAARLELAEAERQLAAYLEAVDAAGIGSGDAAAGMRQRRERVDIARDRMQAEIARAPLMPRIGAGAEVWSELDAHERNDLLRGLLAAVVVRPVGRGRRVPVGERARVLRYGASLPSADGPPEVGAGVIPIRWPDADGDDVIGVPGGEDAL